MAPWRAKEGAGGHVNDQDVDSKSKPLLEPGSSKVSHQHLVKASFQEEVLSQIISMGCSSILNLK